MAEEGIEEALFKRTESLGLQLEYDSGFLIVARPESADQRDDDAEVEAALLEQLGNHLADVVRIALAKSRAARAQAFIDRQVFVPSIQFFGTLKSCSAEGIVKVGYRRENFKDPELDDVDLVHCGSGGDLLVIVDDERPAPIARSSFSWIEPTTHAEERVRQLFERADSVGLTLAADSGLVLVKRRAIAGLERALVEKTIREIGQSLREITVRLVARARGERGGDFIGRRVLVPAFNCFGTMESSGRDGRVTVRYRDKSTTFVSERTAFCKGDDLLIVPDARPVAEPTASENSETAWQRLLRRVFGD